MLNVVTNVANADVKVLTRAEEREARGPDADAPRHLSAFRSRPSTAQDRSAAHSSMFTPTVSLCPLGLAGLVSDFCDAPDLFVLGRVSVTKQSYL